MNILNQDSQSASNDFVAMLNSHTFLLLTIDATRITKTSAKIINDISQISPPSERCVVRMVYLWLI